MREDLRVTVERIVKEEVRGIGRVDGYDFDDLAQEARLAASLALRRLDSHPKTRRSYSYVRTAVHNALVSTKRDAHVGKRVPHNKWGRRVGVESLDAPVGDDGDDVYTIVANQQTDPESMSAARELLRAIDARLDSDERAALFRVIAENVDISRARKKGAPRALRDVLAAQHKAERVLDRLLRAPSNKDHDDRWECILRSRLHRVDDGARPTKGPEKEQKTMSVAKQKTVELPVPNLEKVTCHATNPNEADRIGYALPNDTEGHAGCVNCNDKFSCIPASIKHSLVQGLSLTSDREVDAVLSGKESLDVMLQRLRERRQIRKATGKQYPEGIPDHLLMVNYGKAEEVEVEEPEEEEEAAEEETEATETEVAEETEETETETEDAADDASETEENNSESEKETTMAKKTGSKKASKKTATKAPAKKAAAKKAAAKPAAPKKERARIPAEKRVGIELPGGTRFLPQPRELSAEQMVGALEKVALGQPFDLAIGMQFVRKLRDGTEQVVTVKKNGFEFGGAIYSSLTAAAMHATGRSVNGNTHFSVSTNSCTEIRGHGVPGGKYSKEGTAKPAGGTKKSAAKKAPAKKAEPAKAAKKVTTKKSAPPPPPAKKAPKKAAKK